MLIGANEKWMEMSVSSITFSNFSVTLADVTKYKEEIYKIEKSLIATSVVLFILLYLLPYLPLSLQVHTLQKMKILFV